MSRLQSITLPLALLAACAPPAAEVVPLDLSDVPRTTERDATEDGLLEVYFTEPGTEPGAGIDVELDDALIALIDAATATVDLCLYEFKHPDVIDAAIAAVDRGVQVRFVGDGDESEDAAELLCVETVECRVANLHEVLVVVQRGGLGPVEGSGRDHGVA